MGHDLVGGQALVEGVMIRQGPRWAAAARRPDGTISTTLQRAEPALAITRRVPVLRGVGALIDSLRIGMAAMRWSRGESTPSAADTAGGPDNAGTTGHADGAWERFVVIGIVSGVLAAFLLLPLGAAALARPAVGEGVGPALIEGVVRLLLFVAYLAMLSLLPGIRRTLEYHGAEHMVIAAHEHLEDRSIDSARDYSVRHPRCGTDFFLLIFVISIVAFALVGHLPAGWLILSRVALAPVVVGVAYEVLRAGGTSHHRGVATVLSAPGLFLQRFTTREPTDDQIAVALAALDRLIPERGGLTTTESAAGATPRHGIA